MKKSIAFFSSAALVMVLLMGSALSENLGNGDIDVGSKNSCTVIVKNSSGSPASGVKVSGQVCGTLTCSGFTEKEYTDRDGEVTITWSDGCRLCYIYVDGRSHEGKYADGETYTFIR